MITLLQQAFCLRLSVPIVLTLSVAPQYLCAWSIWRVLSTFFPRRVFEYVDEIMYDSYQTLIVFFLEPSANTELIFYGDKIPWNHKENVLYLCNHQSTVDWAVVDMVAIRQGTLGYIRYILKDSLRYLPMYGFYFVQHGSIYVKRNATDDMTTLRRKMMEFKRNSTPLWLVIFPEGTRFNVDKPEQLKQSQQFARSKGLPLLHHVLTPKTKAVEVALEELGNHLHAVYDLTVAYKDKHENPVLPRKQAKGLLEFVQNRDQEIHINVRRLTADQIPQDCEERKQWIFDMFSIKDRLLSQFYSDNEEIRGRFPGPRRRKQLPLSRTLPWAMFWIGVLAPFLATKYGRSLYWKGWLAGSVGTVLYMTILYDRLQG